MSDKSERERIADVIESRANSDAMRVGDPLGRVYYLELAKKLRDPRPFEEIL